MWLHLDPLLQTMMSSLVPTQKRHDGSGGLSIWVEGLVPLAGITTSPVTVSVATMSSWQRGRGKVSVGPHIKLKGPLLWDSVLQQDKALEGAAAVISCRTPILNRTC